jgi:hypothetical protein
MLLETQILLEILAAHELGAAKKKCPYSRLNHSRAPDVTPPPPLPSDGRCTSAPFARLLLLLLLLLRRRRRRRRLFLL